jgi:hypothetical protein
MPLPLAIPLIMGGINLATSIGGKIAAGRQHKKNLQGWQKERADLDNWFKKGYNQDFLQTSAAKSAYTKLREALQDNSKTAAQQGVMMGASAEENAKRRKDNLDVIGEGMNKLAGYGTQYKDSIRRQYMGDKREIDNKIDAGNTAKANSWSNTAENAGKGLQAVLQDEDVMQGLSSIFSGMTS